MIEQLQSGAASVASAMKESKGSANQAMQVQTENVRKLDEILNRFIV